MPGRLQDQVIFVLRNHDPTVLSRAQQMLRIFRLAHTQRRGREDGVSQLQEIHGHVARDVLIEVEFWHGASSPSRVG